ncbi:hypothetical protein PTKIN_Ptkin15bG0162700 [Pterospermum kingtungense]
MFVTKQNMADAVAAVSKQLDNVSATLNVSKIGVRSNLCLTPFSAFDFTLTSFIQSTKRHLSRRLESLDWKVEEQMETSRQIANNVDELNSNLSEIGFSMEMIHQMVAGLEGKIELLESKQDVANSGLYYLCQFAQGVKDGVNTKLFQDVAAKLAIDSAAKFQETTVKGLQFLTENNESAESEKPTVNSEENDQESPVKKVPTMTTKIHRSYAGGISWARDIIGTDA